MQFRKILTPCALLALAGCASTQPKLTAVAASPAPTPEQTPREIFRKNVDIHSQLEGAAICVDNVYFGNAPVSLNKDENV